MIFVILWKYKGIDVYDFFFFWENTSFQNLIAFTKFLSLDVSYKGLLACNQA